MTCHQEVNPDRSPRVNSLDLLHMVTLDHLHLREQTGPDLTQHPQYNSEAPLPCIGELSVDILIVEFESQNVRHMAGISL